MAARVVACHQPNFLPWLGFFAKMARADVFILLDDVQFTQGHNRHNWTTRVRILGSNGPQWLSVPVRRAGEGKQRIAELQIEPNDQRWLPKMLKTLESAYGRCAHFTAAYEPVRAALQTHEGRLSALNVELIHRVRSLLGLKGQTLLSSSFGIDAEGTDRLIELTKAAGGDCYLSGDGADGYQLRECYEKAGLRFAQVGFQHPSYPQSRAGEFQPGLSIFDALCNVGAEQTRAMLGAPLVSGVA